MGRTGWHIDGSFQYAPFGYALYHMVSYFLFFTSLYFLFLFIYFFFPFYYFVLQVSVPKSGPTVFCPLTELIEQLPLEQRVRWERLHMISDRRSGPIHPLIYSHPLTKKKVNLTLKHFIISWNKYNTVQYLIECKQRAHLKHNDFGEVVGI